MNFCPHLGARNLLDAPAGGFYLHPAARKRLDAPAGNFCSHLGGRHATNRLDALAENFCSDLAARNRLDAPAWDTVDQSVVLSYSIGFPSLGCKTIDNIYLRTGPKVYIIYGKTVYCRYFRLVTRLAMIGSTAPPPP